MLQAQFMRVINESLTTLWQDMNDEGIDDDLDLGVIVNAQVTINKIIYKLNKRDRERLREEAKK